MLWKELIQGTLNIPTPRPLGEQSQVNVPFVFIGDEGFGLHNNLLRPFGGTHLDQTKRIFNYRLTRARRYVECGFGILANKWRIFHRPLDVHDETAIWRVKACTVLHNFVREKDGFNFENTDLTFSFTSCRLRRLSEEGSLPIHLEPYLRHIS
ncbi:hypothetical protein NQ314_006290 [Rhamnusium bicolor]|uniref:DDE Tnp4 domain-containing protein n=1 Tax=Rhamnusium bicolor TaxID=1586634 RepID=A0AAV8Z777_9CUCU|nr:hypothetical protein NQ314_006290 [Rhamnusium bicolor]